MRKARLSLLFLAVGLSMGGETCAAAHTAADPARATPPNPRSDPAGYNDQRMQDHAAAHPGVQVRPRQTGRLPSQNDCRGGTPCASDHHARPRHPHYIMGDSNLGDSDSTFSRGFHEPLANIKDALIPGACRVFMQKGVQNTQVSWKGNGRAWPVVLRQAVNHAGLYLNITRSPCQVAIATELGTAQSMLADHQARITPNAAKNASTRGDHPSDGAGKSLTYQQFLAGYIQVNLRSATLVDLMRAITPAGWTIQPELSDESLLHDTYDFTAENTRGQVIHTVEKKLGLVIQPYVGSGILVVTEK